MSEEKNFAKKSENSEKNLEKQKISDFSIDHILNRAGKSDNFLEKLEQKSQNFEQTPVFDWLYYTRYHPPRLPRANPLKQPVKRTPGRLPRVPFTPEQLKALENAYKKSMYLSSEEANVLADQLELSSIRVKIWFQNRRARDRRENRQDMHFPEPQNFALDRSWSDEERIFRFS
ncbi:homeobox protein MSH-D [Culicoides brevitarsis]|uniref:homeobox protein MSH-D n=1 Tax=Culicoides brevitarsis TaxID=469753 RepID=UPI00307B6D1B